MGEVRALVVIKAALLFLAAMGVLAIFGKKKSTAGKLKKPGPRRAKRVETAKKCPKCGAYLIGTGPCACGKN